jgi:predicted nucleic acid-binding protein
MTHLLDVNCLISLLDPLHVHNEYAHRWVGSKHDSWQWSTCPLTENAFIRITGKPSYPNWFGSASAALDCLRNNCSQENHRFWPDDLSLLQPEIWTSSQLVTATHLTDLYLLALAVKNGGKLVSFDRSIPANLIRGGPEALIILST